ncbi:MAG: DNA translocase FtsK [Gemmataceae bacterium]|nr:DNA translocase FtsK [Gemmataceae bacterium]MDW8265211.1 DNA translocase FtsK [Gemmataceae bacterium]
MLACVDGTGFLGAPLMRESRRLPWDLAGGGVLLAGLVVALALFSHDAPGPNVLGPPGTAVAQLLVDTLGWAVYPLLATWFVLAVILLLRRQFLTWSLRLAGWATLVPTTAWLAHAVGGDGGRLGGILHDWLDREFDTLGHVLLAGSTGLLGLLLAADFVVVNLARQLVQVTIRLWGWGRRWAAFVREQRPTSRHQPTSPGPAEHVATTVNGRTIPIRHAHDLGPDVGRDPRQPGSRPLGPDAGRLADFELPPLRLLDDPKPIPRDDLDQHLREQAALLEKTFSDFNLHVGVVGINTGPVVTQYEVALETGLRVHKVTALADDLALNLRVPSVRIVAPIPGKNTVGIEVPNERRAIVCLKEVILAAGPKAAQAKLPLFLGKDTEGRPLVQDLADMPHLLIAGRTGTGKSVCMNAIILSMLMTRRPDEVRMIMIDPKMLELTEYSRIPHLMHPVVKDMKKAEAILGWAVDKMEERYDLLSRVRVRSIAAYNELAPREIHRRLEAHGGVPDRLEYRLPYIVIFIDEMADLVMTMRKEVEGHIIRLAQKSRAAGIHLVLATQKPTVDVITGLIKSNLPARICFQVTSRTDSRVVLDEMGADKLLGKGDMLFLQPGTSSLIRAQGTYASDREISRVVEHLEGDPCYAPELLELKTAKGGGNLLQRLRDRDELYEQAIEVVVREGRGSVSLLQRALGIGYGRAARLIDFMAEDGIVGEYNGSQAREVLFSPEKWEEVKNAG